MALRLRGVEFRDLGLWLYVFNLAAVETIATTTSSKLKIVP